MEFNGVERLKGFWILTASAKSEVLTLFSKR
jgi:hypothetical protein